MTSREVRQQFLDFFADKGHTIVPSSPVVPLDDPTLMFTNAGMNQFKDVFLATGTRPYTRAADTQKCIRAGGKHNDLDDVGQDTYHHTFFEMLGNWSFGDYFKAEAIQWAWELLTEVWGVDKARLHATYFEGDANEGLEPDDEAARLWRKMTDIDPANIHPGNKKDNFWEMGDTGPCGPCSEIHIDLTPDRSGAPLVNAGDARVIEIWNLVFIQFNRGRDGKLTPLPAKHVDTGMGLERICAVLMGKTSNYDTDVWTPVFDAIQTRTNAPDYTGTLPDELRASTDAPKEPRDSSRADAEPRRSPDKQDEATKGSADPQTMIDVSYRVIADHVRCLTFALTDGAIPSNEGRGYVLRRILRRAVRYGRQYLNMHEPFLCDLVQPLVAHMADAFPELRTAHASNNVQHVTELIRDEEESFGRTLDRGIRLWWEGAYHALRRVVNEEQMHKPPEARMKIGLGTHVYQDPRDDEPEEFRGIPVEQWHFSVWGHPRGYWSFRLTDLSSAIVQRLVSSVPQISGKVAFKLHDTYGFPIDLTELMARERGLAVDIGEYERLMEQARDRSRAATITQHSSLDLAIQAEGPTHFNGYDELDVLTGVLAVYVGDVPRGASVEMREGQEGVLVLDQTPFYAEQGGQVGDTGVIEGVDEQWTFRVRDTRKVGDTYVHVGRCEQGTIREQNIAAFSPGPSSSFPRVDNPTLAMARARVDADRRTRVMRNHTATHLLNWALRNVLGDAVQQKGSLVDPEKTRFDFSHNKPMTIDEVKRVEELVNQKIDANLETHIEDNAKLSDVMKINTLRAVFGEKYADTVRVVSAGADIDEMLSDPDNAEWLKYPVELCGGTHLTNTGDAERFVLVSEEGVAKGIRRVVGITGNAAKQAEATGALLREKLTALAGSPPEQLADALAEFQRELTEAIIPVRVRHELQQRIAELQQVAKASAKKEAAASGEVVMDRVREWLESAETVGGITIVIGEVPAAPPDALRGAIDWVRNKTEASAVLLATGAEGKVTLIAGMSKAAVKHGLKAGDLIKEIAPTVGGRGGGRPDMAQGGGDKPDAINEALEAARAWITERCGG